MSIAALSTTEPLPAAPEASGFIEMVEPSTLMVTTAVAEPVFFALVEIPNVSEMIVEFLTLIVAAPFASGSVRIAASNVLRTTFSSVREAPLLTSNALFALRESPSVKVRLPFVKRTSPLMNQTLFVESEPMLDESFAEVLTVSVLPLRSKTTRKGLVLELSAGSFTGSLGTDSSVKLFATSTVRTSTSLPFSLTGSAAWPRASSSEVESEAETGAATGRVEADEVSKWTKKISSDLTVTVPSTLILSLTFAVPSSLL